MLRLLEVLYRAAIAPSGWEVFARDLSRALSGADVELAIRRSEARLGWEYAGSGARELGALVAEQLHPSLERAPREPGDFRSGFVSLDEIAPRELLERIPLLAQWMKPRSLAPDWPLCHGVSIDGSLCGWVLVQPRGEHPFDSEAAFALCDALVPHFARAFAIHAEIATQNRKRDAFEEILDRLATGVILIDADRRVIHANRSANQMLALDDGLALRDGVLRVASEEARALEETLGQAIRAASAGEFDHVGRIRVASRSGGRPFLLHVTPLLSALPGSPLHDAVIVVSFGNPDAMAEASVRALEAIFRLTPAEAAVVRGLVSGKTTDEIAAERGVRSDTTRGQLKQVFAKTGTSRQVDLIRLVLAGISPLSQSLDNGGRIGS